MISAKQQHLHEADLKVIASIIHSFIVSMMKRNDEKKTRKEMTATSTVEMARSSAKQQPFREADLKVIQFINHSFIIATMKGHAARNGKRQDNAEWIAKRWSAMVREGREMRDPTRKEGTRRRGSSILATVEVHFIHFRLAKTNCIALVSLLLSLIGLAVLLVSFECF